MQTDIFSVGMIFLYLIRGDLSLGEVHEGTDSTELIDRVFTQSSLPKRGLYPLLSLIELCLCKNPSKRPTIRVTMEKVIDAFNLVTQSHLTYAPAPHQSLESPSNLSNLALSDFEFGCFENARTRWILSLANHQSNIDVIWNLTLFRWRIGEITPVEFIEILCQHQCQYYLHNGSDWENSLIQSMIVNVVEESMYPNSPVIKHVDSFSSFTLLDNWNLFKVFVEINDPFSLSVTSCTCKYELTFEPVHRKFNEKVSRTSSAISSSPFGLTSCLLCLDPESDSISVVEYHNNTPSCLSVGEICAFESTCFFVERPVGCDFAKVVPGISQDDPLLFLLLEGRWATEIDPESLDDISNDDQSVEMNSCYGSNGSQSTPSDHDHKFTPAPPKRHYVLVIGTYESTQVDFSQNFHILGVIDIIGICADQRPLGIKLLLHDSLCVVGSSGLLASIKLPNSLRKRMSVRVTHINADEYLWTSTNPDSSNHFEFRCKASHSVESTVTDVSFSERTGTLVSGDCRGYLCLWKKSKEFIPFKLVGFPLHVGGRIQRVVHSIDNMSTLVSTDRRLLLVQLHSDSLTPTLYVQSVLDSVSPFASALYAAQFVGDCIHVWKLTAVQVGKFNCSFEEATRNKDEQVYDTMVDEEGFSNGCSSNATHSNSSYSKNLQVEFMIHPNPIYATKRKNRCLFKLCISYFFT